MVRPYFGKIDSDKLVNDKYVPMGENIRKKNFESFKFGNSNKHDKLK